MRTFINYTGLWGPFKLHRSMKTFINYTGLWGPFKLYRSMRTFQTIQVYEDLLNYTGLWGPFKLQVYFLQCSQLAHTTLNTLSFDRTNTYKPGPKQLNFPWNYVDSFGFWVGRLRSLTRFNVFCIGKWSPARQIFELTLSIRWRWWKRFLAE